MLNAIIRFALRNRLVVAAFAVFLLIYGGWEIYRLPIDVFPDLNRPRVVVMTEAPGLAPEEVETLITFPLETALNGATGVQDVRTSSGVGISVIYVEFDWGTDIYNDRQIVNERLALASEQLPEGIKPQLAPISSIMGQIMIVGMYSQPNDKTLLFTLDHVPAESLDNQELPTDLRRLFAEHQKEITGASQVQIQQSGHRWSIVHVDSGEWYTALNVNDTLQVHSATSPMELRTLADWVVRQQLLTIPGVSQVFVMGGQRKQFQVLVNPDLLLKNGVTLHEVEMALERSNQNATGGYLDEQGPHEYLVRALGRVQAVDQLEEIVVKHRDGRSILLRQVARIVEGPQVKRGDSAAYVLEQDGFAGGAAVALTINKQPDADTRRVSEEIAAMLEKIEGGLPDDIQIHPELYQQKSFIDLAIENVIEALRDGGILVVIILFVFLLNFRTTFITLTAIPLSIVITGLIFTAFGLSINTMTLGGLAVAIGELVDDAIVDVENIFRRLRENRHRSNPKHPLLVVFQASVEIRNSIVFGTMIVVLVFIPLFALSGMEGRLFTPLGVAYIVSILASLLVSLTVTPVLSYWLLSVRRPWPWILAGVAPLITFSLSMFFLDGVFQSWATGTSLPTYVTAYVEPVIFYHLVFALITAPVLWALVLGSEFLVERVSDEEQDGIVLRVLKSIAGQVIRVSTYVSVPILALALAAVMLAAWGMWRLESDFLPPFNEGAVQVNVLLPPGTSLQKSNEIAATVEERLQTVGDLEAFVRKTGRAELDEHAEGVNVTEFVASFDPHTERSREAILEELRDKLSDIPGIVVSVEQPLAHLISHMLSGVKAQVAIKLYGDDLDVLRRNAQEIKAAIADVPGVKDLQVEPQVTIPQLRIEVDGHQLAQYGLTRGDVTEYVETAMNGKVVSRVLEGQRTFDLLVRLDEPYREDLEKLDRLSIELPEGGTTKLESVAKVYRGGGPNTINREQVRRRIIVQCNVSGRGLVDVVEEIKRELEPIDAALPTGYYIDYGGQFKSQQSASQMIFLLFLLSLGGMFMVLYTMFRSVNLSLQVMVALPMAFIGSVAALYVTGQTLTVASMVGFISLCGIASRNGILLINHYLHLVKHEGEQWTRNMIVRAGQERLAPVLMTALTSGIGLIPLAMAAGEPGKEILYPVATVIIGGLISSTLLEFLVRPALFWMFGMRAAERTLSESTQKIPLVEEGEEPELDAPAETTSLT